MKNSKDVAIQIGDWDSLPNEMKYLVFQKMSSIEELTAFAKTNKKSMEEAQNYLHHMANTSDPKDKNILVKQLKHLAHNVNEKLSNVQNHLKRYEKLFMALGIAALAVGAVVAISNPILFAIYVPCLIAGVVSFFGSRFFAQKLNPIQTKQKNQLTSFLDNICDQIKNIKTNQKQPENNTAPSSYKFSLLKSLCRKSDEHKAESLESNVEAQNENQNNNDNSFTK